MHYIVALDQGTTSCRTIIYDTTFKEVAMVQKEITQFFPHAGWVEHDAEEIWQKQLKTCKEAIEKAKINVQDILCIGITNQRETIVAWDKTTGKPFDRAIVWQDTRTAESCKIQLEELPDQTISSKTGLRTDPYFSSSKIQWLLNNNEKVKSANSKGNLCIATIDSWLLSNLTKGKIYATDASNASRTNLYNVIESRWDAELLHFYQISESILPEVKPTMSNFGYTDKSFFGREIPITGMAGDQQAALFGHTCFEPGMAKNTFGTGCFILQNIGKTFVKPQDGLLTTIAWQDKEEVTYAFEGSVFNAGAALQWLKEGLGLFNDYTEMEHMVQQVPDSDGVMIVPAFNGLGTPYWDSSARGIMIGLTRRTNKNHIVRATIESLAYQTRDIVETMSHNSKIANAELRVDGGVSKSHYLLQFLSEILQNPVRKNVSEECTALGAAMIAAYSHGVVDKTVLKNYGKSQISFYPKENKDQSEALYLKWKNAVDRSRGWEK